MGLFKLFSRKQKKDAGDGQAAEASTERKKESRRPVRLNTLEERIGYIKDNCETIVDNNRQKEEAKAEYQAVTSYLTDMQKIELIPPEERGALEEAATNIINLSKERGKLQKKSSILPDKQYHIFEQFEQQLPKEMRTIRENEEYQSAIEQDLNHLEKARLKLDHEQEDIIGKQSFLKGIAVTISCVVIVLFVIFIWLSGSSDADYTLPFILTVVMAMCFAYYIVMEARKNVADIKLVQAKLKRQVMLVNKVKIKAVNNLNYLEYTYSKYMVDNFEQLRILWAEYVKMKEEEKKYQKNTDALDFHNTQLMNELRKYGISDTEIWIYQPTAILDSKEMVEVRHRLNVRRQKLRDRIESNQKQREEALKEIDNMIKNYPDCRGEAEKLLRRYRIEI
jgi:hypothetical protein